MRSQSMHPVHLLDDLLASLAKYEHSTASTDHGQDGDDGPCQSPVAADATTALAEAKQDLVLRAADDLFRNNVSLLENALALLDEQEQYQTNQCKENNDNGNTDPIVPVIRKIRAKRSGREAILVRKQRKKPGKKSRAVAETSSKQMTSNDIHEEKPKNIIDEYYLCLIGKDQIDQHTLLTSNGHCKIHRQGAHCTCRSFFQNIKGGTKRSEATAQSSCSDNVVVCKHLLAAILMPHLLPWSNIGVEAEILDDRKFAKLVTRASIG